MSKLIIRWETDNKEECQEVQYTSQGGYIRVLFESLIALINATQKEQLKRTNVLENEKELGV